MRLDPNVLAAKEHEKLLKKCSDLIVKRLEQFKTKDVLAKGIVEETKRGVERYNQRMERSAGDICGKSNHRPRPPLRSSDIDPRKG